jgi:hypothetical protein
MGIKGKQGTSTKGNFELIIIHISQSADSPNSAFDWKPGMTNSLFFGGRQCVGRIITQLNNSTHNVNVIWIVLKHVSPRVRCHVNQAFSWKHIKVTLVCYNSRKIWLQQVGVSLFEDPAFWAVGVEVGNVHGQGFLRGFVHVNAKGKLSEAETLHLVEGKHFDKRLGVTKNSQLQEQVKLGVLKSTTLL